MPNPNFTQIAIGVVVSIILVGAVLVAIIDSISTEVVDVDHENPDPVGDLRLSYITGDADKSYSFTVSSDTVSVTGDWEGSVSLSQNQIIIGSDGYSLTVKDGKIYETVANVPVEKDGSFDVTVTGGKINGTPYTYAYLPDSEGAYANYSSYEYGDNAYSMGMFAGTAISSIGSTVSGDNPYDMTATENKDGDTTTGVTYGKD